MDRPSQDGPDPEHTPEPTSAPDPSSDSAWVGENEPVTRSTPDPVRGPEAEPATEPAFDPGRAAEPGQVSPYSREAAAQSVPQPVMPSTQLGSGTWPAYPTGSADDPTPPSGFPAAPEFPPTSYPAPAGYQPVSGLRKQRATKRERPARDPLAVALGNASLLSVGYLLLRRPVLAVLTLLVTVGLVLVLALSVQTLWFELVVVGWWLALIAHGWFLARGKRAAVPPAQARRHRLVALGLAVVVLAAFGVMRWDSARIDQEVAAARADGDCARAQDTLAGRWFGHRVANAPLFVQGDDTVRACGILDSAAADFDTALSGDTDALESAFGRLTTVLADLPGHQEMATVVLEEFLKELPVEDNCTTATITDGLDERRGPRSMLGRVDEVVTRVAPPAIVGCGDDLMASKSWEQARDRYQQLLDQYPDHELVARATEGVRLATQQIELARVVALLQTPNVESQPEYCRSPAAYSAATPYSRPGPNPAMMYGNGFVHRVPAEWKATDVTKAVTVVCAGATQFGAVVETCPYEPLSGPGGLYAVTFHKIAIPVRVYEIRTGKLVNEVTVEISGASCPNIIQYRGLPPRQTHVAASDGDVHAGFRGLIFPA